MCVSFNILQWNLVITRTLGPWKLPSSCYNRFFLKKRRKRNIKSWDQQNYLVNYKRAKLYPTYLLRGSTVSWNLLTLKGPGGGGIRPPLDVSRDNFAENFFRAASFHDFFLSSFAQLLALFSEKSGVWFESYATLCTRASAQNF